MKRSPSEVECVDCDYHDLRRFLNDDGFDLLDGVHRALPFGAMREVHAAQYPARFGRFAGTMRHGLPDLVFAGPALHALLAVMLRQTHRLHDSPSASRPMRYLIL
jgi:hypothetical protein